MSNLVKVIIVDPVHNEDATVTTTVVLDPLPEPLKKFSRGMPVVVKYKQLGHWPGMIDTAKEGMVKKPWLTKVKKQVVFLFGFADHTWINEDKIFDYQENKNLIARVPAKSRTAVFQKAYTEIEEFILTKKTPLAQDKPGEVITKSEEAAETHFRQHQCIRRAPPACPNCGRLMTYVRVSTRNTSRAWRCPRHKGHKVYPRVDSFLQDSKLPFSKIAGIIWCWSKNMSNKKTEDLIGVSHKHIVNWFRKLRGIAAWWLQQNPQQCGGVGIICEIDESLMAKRKFHVGHQVKQRWVFGGVCQHGCGFMQEVPDRTAATLLPIIQQHIAPGTEIHSDMWAAYNGIANLAVAPAYSHFTVNHSVEFVSAQGATTNHVECFWKNAKAKFKRMNGVDGQELTSYLKEFMWFKRNGDDPHTQILEAISQRYPTP